ncbi:hypothetical protein SHIRM173S_10022 [Streptomyces hirsutus]
MVDTAAADLRRIERDLHDGAQARLVNLAMGLGLAKEKLLEDPDAAASMVEEAHGEVKLALQELRDLARGIHPAVLTDRGLDAALSSVASRCTVPVRVTVDLTERPAAAIEGIAYFTVSRLLQNVSKHSAARTASVEVWRSEGRLLIQVEDDGHGGASLDGGTGMRGLADRLGAVDGLFVVESPEGGPTTVTAELPWRDRSGALAEDTRTPTPMPTQDDRRIRASGGDDAAATDRCAGQGGGPAPAHAAPRPRPALCQGRAVRPVRAPAREDCALCPSAWSTGCWEAGTAAGPAGRAGAEEGHGGRGIMEDKVRVVIAEDSALLREGLTRLLTDRGLDVVAGVGDGDALIKTITELNDQGELPDVVVADVRIPPMHTDEGVRAAVQLRKTHPGVGVLVLSQYVEERYATELLAGSSRGIGYLLKDRVAEVREFVDAVVRVAEGGTALDPEVVAQLLGRSRKQDVLAGLTPREREVLGLMAEGRTNSAIARQLVVSDGAVEKHVSNIFLKLGLSPSNGDHRRVLAVLTYLNS